MNEDRLNELLGQCESPIERELLNNLYPYLPTSRARELRDQHMIDRYDDMPLTIPDFGTSLDGRLVGGPGAPEIKAGFLLKIYVR